MEVGLGLLDDNDRRRRLRDANHDGHQELLDTRPHVLEVETIGLVSFLCGEMRVFEGDLHLVGIVRRRHEGANIGHDLSDQRSDSLPP
jgi:hypothetical protein